MKICQKNLIGDIQLVDLEKHELQYLEKSKVSDFVALSADQAFSTKLENEVNKQYMLIQKKKFD